MVSPSLLLSTIESVLLGPSPPTPYQRIELMHAIRSSLPSFRPLLSYPAPKALDRSQVQSKEARLPDSRPISLNDQDLQIVKEMKEKTMSALSPYVGGSRELRQEGDVNSQQITQLKSLPFVSLLELVSEIYQVYDMRYELNEVEARMEKFPFTISFLNLLNALIVEERDVSDRGRRFVGIFRFVYDLHLGHFLREPMLISVRNGSWLLHASNTFECEHLSKFLIEN